MGGLGQENGCPRSARDARKDPVKAQNEGLIEIYRKLRPGDPPTLDTATRQLVYTVTFQGLTGPATMAHFHGPAAAGVNAGIVVKLGDHPTSPIKGSAQLTEAQAADLEAGKWYANVHTAAHPSGEIRGQLERAD